MSVRLGGWGKNQCGIVTQDCVAGLSRLGVGLASVISEELASADNDGDSDENEGESVVKAATAEDFTDIIEVSIIIYV